MSDILLERVPTRIASQTAWAAYFTAPTPTDLDVLAFVIIPAFDTGLKWGPMRWQSRDATSLPVAGDPCLVLRDENNIAWVVAWWPFSS